MTAICNIRFLLEQPISLPRNECETGCNPRGRKQAIFHADGSERDLLRLILTAFLFVPFSAFAAFLSADYKPASSFVGCV
jgi:hypothetical protein